MMAKAKPSFLDFMRIVVKGDAEEVLRALKAEPSLATMAAGVGASRRESTPYFFKEVGHYLYAGDTALHLAAAGFYPSIAKVLVKRGADVSARNRRGAQAIHYAADAGRWEPTAQGRMIAYLLSAGADANAVDKNGVAPLHRAVRTRSLAAVRALLDGGADVRLRNGAGSTPLHLAVQTTGATGSGSERARDQQAAIIRLLLERGARVSDKDGKGTPVRGAARSAWVRELLGGGK